MAARSARFKQMPLHGLSRRIWTAHFHGCEDVIEVSDDLLWAPGLIAAVESSVRDDRGGHKRRDDRVSRTSRQDAMEREVVVKGGVTRHGDAMRPWATQLVDVECQ